MDVILYRKTPYKLIQIFTVFVLNRTMLINPSSSESPLLYVLFKQLFMQLSFIMCFSKKLLERQSKFIHEVEQ